MAERTTWTDERIGDEMSTMEVAIELNDRMDRLQDRMVQVGFVLALALFAALMTAILT